MNDTSCLFPPQAAAEELGVEIEVITRYLRKGPLKLFPHPNKTLITPDSMRALEKKLDAEASALDTEEFNKRQKARMAVIERREKSLDRRYLRESIRRQVVAERELEKDLAVKAEVDKRLAAMLDKKDEPEMAKRRTL